MDEKLKCERQNYKTLEDNIQKYLYHTEIKKNLFRLDMNYKSQNYKREIN